MPRARRIVVGGIGTPLIEAGPAEASEAVVFVHGNPGSSRDFEALVDAVGEFGRALAFDMPGFGQADKPRDSEHNVGSYSTFLGQALDQLGITRVHLVLHDFGGPFGLLWGLQHPDAWASTVLFNIGLMPGYSWHKTARRWRTPLLGELMMAWIPRSAWRRQFLSLPGRKLPVEFVDQMYDNFDRDTRRTVLALYRATPDPGEGASWWAKPSASCKAGACALGHAGPVRAGRVRRAPARLLRGGGAGEAAGQRALGLRGRP